MLLVILLELGFLRISELLVSGHQVHVRLHVQRHKVTVAINGMRQKHRLYGKDVARKIHIIPLLRVPNLEQFIPLYLCLDVSFM